MEPLKVLFGLIYIREYAYRFVLTNAQIELMAFDLPRVEYNHDKEKAEKMTDAELQQCEDENEKQMRAYIDKIKGEKISLTEYINKE